MRTHSAIPLTLIAALPAIAQTTYTINTVAGGGTSTGNNISATTAILNAPFGVVADSAGNFYIADQTSAAIREVSKGTITTLTATSYPKGVAVDSSGAVYFSDINSVTVSKLVGTTVTAIAGNKTNGFSGDGGAATKAQLNSPYGIAVDSTGDVYIADRETTASGKSPAARSRRLREARRRVPRPPQPPTGTAAPPPARCSAAPPVWRSTLGQSLHRRPRKPPHPQSRQWRDHHHRRDRKSGFHRRQRARHQRDARLPCRSGRRCVGKCVHRRPVERCHT